MAEKMKTLGAPVALVVTFGPTIDLVAPSNVSQVINYYFGTAAVIKGPGLRGTISNVDLSGATDINHLNVEKIDRLHVSVIAKVQALVGHGRAAPITRQGRASPAAAVLGDQTAMMHKAGGLASWVCPSPEPPSATPLRGCHEDRSASRAPPHLFFLSTKIHRLGADHLLRR